MPVSDENTRVSVTISKEMLTRIKALAKEEHRTVSSQIAYELSKALQERLLREGSVEPDEEAK